MLVPITKLSEYEINYKIIQQYPMWVKESLATIDYTDGRLIVQTLAKLDGIREEREHEYKNNQHRYGNPRIRHINTYRSAPREGHREYYRGRTRRGNFHNDYRRENNYRSNYDQNESRVCSLPDTRYPPPSYTPAGNRYENNTPNNDEARDGHLN